MGPGGRDARAVGTGRALFCTQATLAGALCAGRLGGEGARTASRRGARRPCWRRRGSRCRAPRVACTCSSGSGTSAEVSADRSRAR
eukprot:scaffold108484_cov45-Phaeocystis_antarctica.AAC.2